MKNFLISGGTGFIGSALCARLLEGGHSIIVKTRYPKSTRVGIKFINDIDELDVNEKIDVVINLSGEPITNKRWTKSHKQKLIGSRVNSTQELISYFKKSRHKPKLFICGSAIGYYGIEATNNAVNEASLGDESFSSKLCSQLEECALQAESIGIRTCLLRTGIVLGKNGGALSKMLLPFKLGLGGKIGTGVQWMSWIHINDLISIIFHCIDHEELNGPINGTAPYPVSNTNFTKILGETLKRPTLFSMPSMMIKLLMGEMGKELLLSGKKVLPSKVKNTGFQFEFERLDKALSNVLN